MTDAPIFAAFAELATDPAMIALAVLALLCGIVRGFTGFGAGLIFMPVASALYAPRLAVIALWIMDSIPGLAIVFPALRFVEWRTVLPVALGYAIFVNAGVALLTRTDPTLLRWLLSLTVFIFVVLLWSRWRYQGPRPAWLSAGVGGLAGIFGGAAQIPVPPILAYWLASDAKAVTVRANLIAFLALSAIVSGFAFYAGGVFNAKAIATGAAISPFYLAGLLIGARLFKSFADRHYRRVAFFIILASAIAGLPMFDALRG